MATRATHTRNSSVGIVILAFLTFIAGLIVYFVTEPVSSVSSVLFVISTIAMLGATIILAFGFEPPKQIS